MSSNTAPPWAAVGPPQPAVYRVLFVLAPIPISKLDIARFLFMTFVVDRKPGSPAEPVHVIIVMVGAYLKASANLPGAGAFVQTVVDFWRTLPSGSFPSAQMLASIKVLASDPAGVVSIRGDGGSAIRVDRPDFTAIQSALLAWAQRVRDEGGVGFLHWIGHGMELIKGGSVVSLSCDGALSDGVSQAGLDWTTSLHVINNLIRERPVYCFIDVCRSQDKSTLSYLPIAPADLAAPDNACVFYSTSRGKKAFWIRQLKLAAENAGCGEYAIGTQAFLAALKSFGARLTGDPADVHVPIVAAEVVEASQALVERWSRHQGITPPPGDPQGPSSCKTRAILLTEEPKSIVTVLANGVASPTSCEALSDTPPPVGSESAAPFEFRLARKPHKFRFDDQNWNSEKRLLHPYMKLSS
ncbi:hypothetical protein [Xanthobacter sp. ZOL 2024]